MSTDMFAERDAIKKSMLKEFDGLIDQITEHYDVLSGMSGVEFLEEYGKRNFGIKLLFSKLKKLDKEINWIESFETSDQPGMDADEEERYLALSGEFDSLLSLFNKRTAMSGLAMKAMSLQEGDEYLAECRAMVSRLTEIVKKLQEFAITPT